ncbi:MAG: XisI protein [Geitlerinemataceae cyanobacterium]
MDRIEDKIDLYQQLIEQLLIEYSKNDPIEEGVETQLVFDTERHHYHWMNVGWDDLRHVHYSIVHFDIKDGKIWIQKNLTEADPAEDLVELGVAKEDIVLGLHPPYKRPYTDYGVA